MSKKLVINEVDKEERIRKQNQKRKSMLKDKIKEEGFEKKAKNRKINKSDWLKNYDLYDEEEEDYDFEF